MATRKNRTQLQRTQLDRKLAAVRGATVSAPPGGWIRSIREALGLSVAQLAHRVGIAKQTISKLERSERVGTISISTLRKLAQAMDCEVSVVVLPRSSLQKVVEKRAQEVARKVVARTNLHMKLENQETEAAYQKQKIKELAEELIRNSDKRLWEDL